MPNLGWYYQFYTLTALTAAGILLSLSLYAWQRHQLMALLALSLLIHAVRPLRPPYRFQSLVLLLATGNVFLSICFGCCVWYQGRGSTRSAW